MQSLIGPSGLTSQRPLSAACHWLRVEERAVSCLFSELSFAGNSQGKIPKKKRPELSSFIEQFYSPWNLEVKSQFFNQPSSWVDWIRLNPKSAYFTYGASSFSQIHLCRMILWIITHTEIRRDLLSLSCSFSHSLQQMQSVPQDARQTPSSQPWTPGERFPPLLNCWVHIFKQLQLAPGWFKRVM
jgi:hypothetical protein